MCYTIKYYIIYFFLAFCHGLVNIEMNSIDSKLPIHVAAVVCSDESRVDELLVNFKSIVLHSNANLFFHVFSEDKFHEIFNSKLEQLQIHISKNFDFKVHKINYPDDQYTHKWKKLFKPCASQRLFIPYLLKDVDSIIYVDTDVLFLGPIENLWRKFKNFNSTQLSAMVIEHEQTSAAWYSRFARHPYYGLTGVNSGVMLMNMTRMRSHKFRNDVSEEEMNWDEMMLPLLKKYQFNITWGDQCLLNIIFHFNPDKLLEIGCDFNYRPDHCMYMELCAPAVESGVKVLHGCRRAFHKDKWPVFKSVYQSIAAFNLTSDYESIVTDVSRRMEQFESSPTSCEGSTPHITKLLKKNIPPPSIREEL